MASELLKSIDCHLWLKSSSTGSTATAAAGAATLRSIITVETAEVIIVGR